MSRNNGKIVACHRDRIHARYHAGFSRLRADALDGKQFRTVFVFTSSKYWLSPVLQQILLDLAGCPVKVICAIDLTQVEALR